MPNVKSAIKRVRISEKKRARNASAKSAIKTYTRRYEAAIADGDKEGATSLFAKVSSMLDKAASKGIIHKNKAARRKSRLAAKL
jgi:small subunit ribosomal protein S20